MDRMLHMQACTAEIKGVTPQAAQPRQVALRSQPCAQRKRRTESNRAAPARLGSRVGPRTVVSSNFFFRISRAGLAISNNHKAISRTGEGSASGR